MSAYVQKTVNVFSSMLELYVQEERMPTSVILCLLPEQSLETLTEKIMITTDGHHAP